ncbi:MAG: hypothetical protein IKJ95_06070 [Bacteroidaceae bacterium]|nr:hypothetical protein [Bacteroidaceae bacterium]
MHQVIKVIREDRKTIVYLKTKETHTIQVYKDTDIASVEWKPSADANKNSKPKNTEQ